MNVFGFLVICGSGSFVHPYFEVTSESWSVQLRQ